MKKHNKPGSPPKRRKGHAAPLPLDTSRSRRPAAPKQATQSSAAQPKQRTSTVARNRQQTWHRPFHGLWRPLTTLSRADRADAAMLALPLLLLAFTIAVGRWTNADQSAPQVATVTSGAKRALTGLPPVATPVIAVSPAERAATVDHGSPEVAPASPAVTRPIGTATPSFDVAVPAPQIVAPAAVTRSEPAPVPAAAPTFSLPSRAPDAQLIAGLDHGPSEPIRAGKIVPATVPPATPAGQQIAILTPDRTATTWELPGGIEALSTGLAQCPFDPSPPRTPQPVSWTPGDPDSFGLALASAARRQLSEFVIYNDRYTRLKYPMGDVHPMYGVCTDVVIRAYRALGLDLQELVQKTKTGSGDPNIDHRRVDTLRKFFSRFGENLPISSFAEDFKPGDIVTYWRPQNRHSRTHIAVVSDMVGPSGRPLIIHNRGWGPQQEDGLFVDEITGHYRFSGLKASATEPQNATAKKALSRTIVRTGLTPPTPPPL